MIQLIWGEVSKSVFPTSSQEMLKLLVQRLHFENHRFTPWSLVVIGALKYLSANFNIWDMLDLLCVDLSFLLRMGLIFLLLHALSNSGLKPGCFKYISQRLWIVLYSSQECWFFCFSKQLTWLDSNYTLCLLRSSSNLSSVLSSLARLLGAFLAHTWFRDQLKI